MQPIKLMKFWRQFTVLVQRNLRLILNDKLTMASLILQAPFMVLVIKMVVDPDCFTSNLINICTNCGSDTHTAVHYQRHGRLYGHAELLPRNL